MAIDYGQLANQYFTRRMDNAMQPFTDTEGYLNNRLQQQYGVGLDEEGNVKPRSTTITNNDDGTQTITTKSELTPTAQPQQMVQPVAPVAPMAQPMEVNVAQPQQMMQPPVTTQPAAPVALAEPVTAPAPMAAPAPVAAPVAPEPVMAAPVVEAAPAVQLPQAGEPVQLAGPMVPGAVASQAQPVPVAPQAQPSPTAVAAPAPVAAPQPAPAAPEVPAWSTALQNSQGNVTKLYAIAGNETFPKEVQGIAAQMAARLTKGELDQQQAGKTIEKWLTGDKSAANDVMQDLRKEEGSYVKAYLFNRLGFTDLAKQEMQKISPDTKIAQSVLEGKQYTVEADNRGAIIRAWDSEGTRQDAKTLAALNAGGMKAGTQAYGFTSGIHTLATGEPLQARQNSITGATEFVHTIGPKRGQIYTGTEIPLPQRVQTSTQVAYNQKLVDFATNPSIAAATELVKLAAAADPGDGSEINKARAQVGRVLGPQALGQVAGITIGGGQLPNAPAPTAPTRPAATMPAPVTVPAPTPIAQTTPATAAPMADRTTVAPAVSPFANLPTPVAPTAAAAPTAPAVAPSAGGISGRLPGESFDAYQQRIKLSTAGGEAAIQLSKEVEADRLKDVNEVKKALPGNESSATAILRTVDDVLTHPGYKDVIGLPSLSGMANVYGTNARDFRAKYNQLMGQQFLAAFNQLKGGGSITEVEGQKAEQAIAALRDPNISEKEFKRNADILKQTVRSGIDRQRVTVGFEPRYTAFTDEEKKAFNWARSNPRDPRSQEIINRLQNR